MDTPAASTPEHGQGKAKRVLACQLCQQRKVKCDRKFPCSNCVRGNARCVPATLVPRQRRRRFPERDLLARIRHYEGLLQQHGIAFEPLHPPAPGHADIANQAELHSPVTQSEPSPASDESRASCAKPRLPNIWQALSENLNPQDEPGDDHDEDTPDSGFLHGGDDAREAVIKNIWDHANLSASDNTHHLLFGNPASRVDLATLHPDQAKIFRLWQVYLDNVNPLLKVIHTPTLQTRIIDAIGDLTKISPPLEALLFSIYCVSLLSLDEDQCQALFGSLRKELLAGYQFACRQALLNANVLQSSDHDCLTALFLYLVSIKPETDPRALSSLLAAAVRIAQQQGYHAESSNVKRPVLEAEMRRRLWWALVTFDARVCETFTSRVTTMAPTWDCSVPLNLNDFDLRPDMKTVPPVHDRPTEALFVSVRCSLGDLVRHSAFHLDFIDPFLTTLARAKKPIHPNDAEKGRLPDLQKKTDQQNLLTLQTTLERDIFPLLDPDNPLHFMTIWTARGQLAKSRLMEHCSWPSPPDHPSPSSPPLLHSNQKHVHPNPGITHALRMLESDTVLMSSPLSKPFHWHTQSYFPFLAYAYIVHYLKKRPHEAASKEAAVLWEAMDENYQARQMDWAVGTRHHPLFWLFARVILQAWEAVAHLDKDQVKEREVPRIVRRVQDGVGQMHLQGDRGIVEGRGAEREAGGEIAGMGVGDAVTGDMPLLNVGGGDAGGQPLFGLPGLGAFLGMMPGDPGMEFMEMDHFWPTTDWVMQGRGW